MSISTIDKQKIEIEDRLFNLEKRLKNKSLNKSLAQNKLPFENIPQIGNQSTIIRNNLFLNSRNDKKDTIIKDTLFKDTIMKENNFIQNRVPKYIGKNTINFLSDKVITQQKKYDEQMIKMMRDILEGQRQMQEEIIQMKKMYSREETTRQLLKQQLSRDDHINKENRELSLNNSDKSVKRLSKTNCHLNKSTKKSTLLQDSFIDSKKTKAYIQALQENLKSKNQSVQKKVGTVRKNCDKFAQLINLVKTQALKQQCSKVKITEEVKKRVWNKVKERKIENDKLFIDIIHKNNKHLYEHLIYTNELQKKLKGDLQRKVYSTCNNLIYK